MSVVDSWEGVECGECGGGEGGDGAALARPAHPLLTPFLSFNGTHTKTLLAAGELEAGF